MFMQPAHLDHDDIAPHPSAPLSFVIAAPSLVLALFFMQSHFTSGAPEQWVIGVLGFAALNLLCALALEPYLSRLGRLTMPALLGAVAVVLLYLLADVVDRHFVAVNGELLLPFLVPGMGLCYLGIFREPSVALRLLLSLNGLMLALVWCLSAAHDFMLTF